MTGQPTTRHQRIRVSWAPGWIWATLPLGILPYAILRATAGKNAQVTAPLTPRGAARRWLRSVGAWVGLGLLLVGFINFPSVSIYFLLAFLVLVIPVITLTWPHVRTRAWEDGHIWVRVHPDALEDVPEYEG